MAVSIILETNDAWTKRVTKSYKKWKKKIWEPADKEERIQLQQSLQTRPDDEVVHASALQQVKKAAKQFGALVSLVLCVGHQADISYATGCCIQQC